MNIFEFECPEQEVIAAYVLNKVSINELAECYDMSVEDVTAILKANNIKLRKH